MSDIDFRKGAWGHRLHGSTMSRAEPTLMQRYRDWRDNAVRGSMLCHTSPPPREGDFAVWNTENGKVRAPIYKVERLGDPADMYRIFVRITPDCRTPRTGVPT